MDWKVNTKSGITSEFEWLKPLQGGFDSVVTTLSRRSSSTDCWCQVKVCHRKLFSIIINSIINILWNPWSSPSFHYRCWIRVHCLFLFKLSFSHAFVLSIKKLSFLFLNLNPKIWFNCIDKGGILMVLSVIFISKCTMKAFLKVLKLYFFV